MTVAYEGRARHALRVRDLKTGEIIHSPDTCPTCVEREKKACEGKSGMTKKRVGIDIGGVIMDKANDKTDTSFFEGNYLESRATAGCFAAIRSIVNAVGPENVFVISKCGQKTQDRSMEWFKYHDFYGLTGVLEENIHFCRKREEKAPIAEKLGLTHFIDDRLEVLSYLKSVKYKYLFQPAAAEVEKFAAHLPDVKTVYSWAEVLENVDL